MQADFNKLTETYGVDDVFFTGDMTQHGPNQTTRPHVEEAAYDRLWSLVEGAIRPGKLRAYIPGNHEVPIQTFLESDDRTTLRKRIDYDAAGVSVFLINTHGPGFTPGDLSGENGMGVTVPRIPRRDLEWLDKQMADAGSNAKLVLPHAPPYGFPGKPSFDVENNTGPSQRYEVCENQLYAHKILSSYNKVVVPVSHLFQFGSDKEDSHTIDGVHYVEKQHYYEEATDEVYTFGRINVTSSGCQVVTEEHSDGTTYTPLDVTF